MQSTPYCGRVLYVTELVIDALHHFKLIKNFEFQIENYILWI